MGEVGPFFYVNNQLLQESIPITEAEVYGDFKIGKRSHDEIWNEKYFKKYRHPYDYYPRGRVVYKFHEDKYTLYADKCIDEDGLNRIISGFKLENKKVQIVRSDSHYLCKNCNKQYYE